MRQHSLFQLDDILGSIDEAELEVQGIVFRQMPTAGMGFRAIDVTGFEHPLEACDAMLFVELRALGQIGGLLEVLDGEEIAAAFRARGNNLGSNDFLKMLPSEIRAEVFQYRRLDPEDIAQLVVAAGERTIVDPCVRTDRR